MDFDFVLPYSSLVVGVGLSVRFSSSGIAARLYKRVVLSVPTAGIQPTSFSFGCLIVCVNNPLTNHSCFILLYCFVC